MCYDASYNGNKTQVCTVGDLKPGQRYRDPEGNDLMVAEGHLIVNLTNGATTSTLDWIVAYRKDIKLGTDRQGRLYASRSLNPTAAPAGFADAPANAIDADQAQAIFSDPNHEVVDLNDAFDRGDDSTK